MEIPLGISQQPNLLDKNPKNHPISFLRPNPAGLMPIADHEKPFSIC